MDLAQELIGEAEGLQQQDRAAEDAAAAGADSSPEDRKWFRDPVEPGPGSLAVSHFLSEKAVGWVGGRLGVEYQPGTHEEIGNALAPVIEKYKGEPPAWLVQLVDGYREEVGLGIALASFAFITWQLHRQAQSEPAEEPAPTAEDRGGVSAGGVDVVPVSPDPVQVHPVEGEPVVEPAAQVREPAQPAKKRPVRKVQKKRPVAKKRVVQRGKKSQ